MLFTCSQCGHVRGVEQPDGTWVCAACGAVGAVLAPSPPSPPLPMENPIVEDEENP
jgi:ribosomal protein L37AE/L43A